MIRGGTSRLRKGDWCEPKNYRRNGNTNDRFYLPMAFVSNSYVNATPNDGIVAWPFVLPKATRFNWVGWYVNGIGTQTYLRFGFYATDPLNKTDFPYPGKLIWGMPSWRLIGSSGYQQDGAYDPPIILPGNQLIWACQSGYTLHSLGMEGGITCHGDYDVNPGFGKVGVPNVLGVASAGDEYFSSCYFATGLGDNYSWPNPFPTSSVSITDRNLPLFGFRLA